MEGILNEILIRLDRINNPCLSVLSFMSCILDDMKGFYIPENP